jgi:hypothetical protein
MSSRRYANGIPSAFQGQDEDRAVFPFLFQVLSPDRTTLLLPEALYLHVNPASLTPTFAEDVQRIQTLGGWVEQHWGQVLTDLSASGSSGAFLNVHTGLTSGPLRRETIAYDKYLDMLALFHNNGSIYDATGKIVFQGSIKITFDGGVYLGWFQAFNVQEAAEKPYQFDLSAEFTVASEVLRLRSAPASRHPQGTSAYRPPPQDNSAPQGPRGGFSIDSFRGVT